MDAWHGTLLGAITTLSGVIAALWRHIVLTRREQETRDAKREQEQAAKDAKRELQLSRLHAEHKADIRELTQAALELGTAVTVRGLLPPGSEN